MSWLDYCHNYTKEVRNEMCDVRREKFNQSRSNNQEPRLKTKLQLTENTAILLSTVLQGNSSSHPEIDY